MEIVEFDGVSVFVCLFVFFSSGIQWLCVLEHCELNKVHESQLDSYA